MGNVAFWDATFAVVTCGDEAGWGEVDGLNEWDVPEEAGALYVLGVEFALNEGAFGEVALKLGPIGIGGFGIALTVVCCGGAEIVFTGMGTALLRSSWGRLKTDWWAENNRK